jgi:hypothetical protein
MVKTIQEWLWLQGIAIEPDGDFGSVTERAVKLFQTREALPVTGVADQPTYERLTRPLRNALAPIPVAGRNLGQLVVAYAEQHLQQHPREVGREQGRENCGPWVRRYMDGNEGKDWPWCAGFACFVLKQACDTLKVEMPVPRSVSSSALAASAKARKRLVKGTGGNADRQNIAPGYLFLLRGGATGWRHIGIVAAPELARFVTIEGNTNDEGSAEGYEVCMRARDYGAVDYIRV